MSFLLAPTARLVPTSEISTTLNAPTIWFLFFGALVVTGAISTIVRKNDVAAVMSLVATFFGLAAIYTFLGAHFIAVLQVLVYAGAIMVLFIFVVMVLNRDETDPWVWRGVIGKFFLGLVPMVYITARLGKFLWDFRAARNDAPSEDFGTVAQIGELLFTDYLFAFEAVSVLLLIAVIAAVVVARTTKQSEDAAAAPQDPPLPAAAHDGGAH